MNNKDMEAQSKGKIAIYQTKDKGIQLEVKLEQETVWLSQKQISAVFKTERSVITKHLRKIFKSKELDQNSVCAIFAHTASDGKGHQSRSFCYIDDLVEGVLRLMLSMENEPVNLGNPNEFTVMQLAKSVLKLSNSKSRIVFKRLPQDDPKQRQPDISKAKKLLDWKPIIPLDEGLRRTISWFRGIQGLKK